MAQINLKLDADQLRRTDYLAGRLDQNRTAYIREALQQYNASVERQLLADRLRAVSHKVREESLTVAIEMEAVEAPLPDEDA